MKLDEKRQIQADLEIVARALNDLRDRIAKVNTYATAKDPIDAQLEEQVHAQEILDGIDSIDYLVKQIDTQKKLSTTRDAVLQHFKKNKATIHVSELYKLLPPHAVGAIGAACSILHRGGKIRRVSMGYYAGK